MSSSDEEDEEGRGLLCGHLEDDVRVSIPAVVGKLRSELKDLNHTEKLKARDDDERRGSVRVSSHFDLPPNSHVDVSC